MTDRQIAETILEQMGGGRFIAMTGSKNFKTITGGLDMTLAKNASKANRLKITLTGMDDYNMEFYKFTPYRVVIRDKGPKPGVYTYPEKVTTVKRYEHIYFDQLQELFTRTTGLYTRLF